MPTTRNRPQIPTFAEVARLVAPSDTPPWLPAHLEWWAAGVRHDQIADECRPTNVQTRERLAAFATAARLIERELNAPAIRNLLSEAKSTGRISISSWSLRDLASRADNVFSSPLLSSANGETKRGRSKPRIPGLFNARTLCAARILEMCAGSALGGGRQRCIGGTTDGSHDVDCTQPAGHGTTDGIPIDGDLGLGGDRSDGRRFAGFLHSAVGGRTPRQWRRMLVDSENPDRPLGCCLYLLVAQIHCNWSFEHFRCGVIRHRNPMSALRPFFK
jgi:hypothetical protein